ncbi:MAG: Pr6Pr family membrane protein [Pyrinomonadaceae bacterium]
MNKIERFAAALIASIAWFGLGLQFYLIMFDPIGEVPAGQRFVNFFSYFTVLSNLIVAISLTARLVSPGSPIGQFFSRTNTRTAVAVYITVVGLVYTLVLRSIWNPSGLALIADRTLHDLVPVLYLLYWLALVGKNGLNWSGPLCWLVYPLLYMTYSIVRGAIMGWYPYPFVDVTQLGYPTALGNSALVVVAFFVIGILFVAIGKLMSRTANTAPG